MLSTLEYASRRPFSGVLLIANAGPAGDGSGAVELATAAAADGRRVVVVDARTPRKEHGSGNQASERPSLVQLARPDVALTSVARYWTAVPGMQIPVVSARIPDSAGGWLGPSRSVERALLRLSNEVDLVVIDAPSVAADETFLLIGLADAGVLVVTGQTKADELRLARSAFEFASRPLIGFITTAAGKGRSKKTPFSASAAAEATPDSHPPVLAPPSKT